MSQIKKPVYCDETVTIIVSYSGSTRKDRTNCVPCMRFEMEWHYDHNVPKQEQHRKLRSNGWKQMHPWIELVRSEELMEKKATFHDKTIDKELDKSDRWRTFIHQSFFNRRCVFYFPFFSYSHSRYLRNSLRAERPSLHSVIDNAVPSTSIARQPWLA